MPDLLREQFPHFRPIVEAFGYTNLEFEGWEADDVIATLATRADEAGIKTCVVSTDRDAFQLCSENVSLMMTPRGVSDVQVYTPERVEARYGVRPDQVPDFIGLKGDTSDNIPGVPGIGDKTAGQLIAQYGSLEAVLEHVDELSPGRAKALREHGEQARTSKELATMRRDLELGCRPGRARALAARPLRAARALPPFRVPRPPEPDRRPRRRRARRGARARGRDGGRLARGHPARGARAGRPRDRRRPLRARGRRRRRGRPLGAGARRKARERRGGRARREGAPPPVLPGRRHDDRRLPDRAGPRLLRARRPRRRVRRRGGPRARGRGGDRRARPPRRDPPPPGRADARAARRAWLDRALRGDRAAARGSARRDGGRGGQDRHLPDGRDHRPPGRERRGARVARLRARGRGVHARLDPAGRADPVREAAADARAQGQDGLLDRHARAAHDPARAPDRRRDRGVARVLEAPQHLPRARCPR